ncbi:MAG: transporter [Proteobacteria bacterium]|nr:transporter [Pseudomonadota bacterium]
MKKINKVKGFIGGLFAVVIVLLVSGSAMAFGHYTPGALGLGSATLPPPGFHYTMYNMFYTADTLNDDHGNAVNLGLDLTVFAMANQFTYMTDHKILGADFGFDVIVPIVAIDMKMSALGVDESSFGLGDLYFEPFVLGWHAPRWDLSFALGFYAPTADSDEPSSPGSGYWSFMETLGGTYYLDEARTMTVSVLTRWLQNTEDEDTDITPGANVVAEYGIAKTIPVKEGVLLTAGLAGYTYAQLTDDSGAGATDDRYSAHALGPEVRVMVFKPFPMQASFRYLIEYNAESTTEGNNACLTLIGSF